MTLAALVMAGGAGQRMTQSGGDRPKPLMEVGGSSLLSHNVSALLRHGLTDVYLAIPAGNDQIRSHVEDLCRPKVAGGGGTLCVIEETTPLGSMGAAAHVPSSIDTLLVVNADNLTNLDLTDLVRSHQTTPTTITLAVHDQPFHMPFGAITVDGDRVTAYTEKPTYRFTVSSALTVLDRTAIDLIQAGTNVMIYELIEQALSAGLVVRSYAHEARWIDVNDVDALGRAEQLVARDPEHFSGDASDE